MYTCCTVDVSSNLFSCLDAASICLRARKVYSALLSVNKGLEAVIPVSSMVSEGQEIFSSIIYYRLEDVFPSRARYHQVFTFQFQKEFLTDQGSYNYIHKN